MSNTTKKRSPSPSTTIRSFAAATQNLIELKLVNKEDGEKLKELHEKIVKQYIGYTLISN